MKKVFLSLAAIALISTTSCDSDDGGNTPIGKVSLEKMVDADGKWSSEAVKVFEAKLGVNNNAKGADESKFAWTVAKGGTKLPTSFLADAVLTGEIKKNTTLDASKVYELKSDVYVRAGATLTIPAGTVIFSDDTNNIDSGSGVSSADVLIVTQGGKLNVEGTASKPVVFTSRQQKSGTWGGIVILGKAPINIASGNAEIADNVSDTTLAYGGSVANDNSGSLKHVILAYPGTQINTDAEYNGFSFYAVGDGTTLENLEVYQGKDDSFEWFGGTVNATNLYANNFDDSFDYAEGFVGTLDNIVADQPEAADHCIEADNLKANNNATPRSNPRIMNATFKSVGADDAIKLRRGASAQFSNVKVEIATGSKANVEIDDLATAILIENGSTTFTGVKFDSSNAKFAGNINQ